MSSEKELNTIPVGNLGLIPLASCSELGHKVDAYLTKWRAESIHAEITDPLHFSGYSKDSFIISAKTPRFGSGEAKGVIQESVRGYDLFIMVDVCNYSLTYSLCGQINHMSPDDHFQDLKRIIAAVEGKAQRMRRMSQIRFHACDRKKGKSRTEAFRLYQAAHFLRILRYADQQDVPDPVLPELDKIPEEIADAGKLSADGEIRKIGRVIYDQSGCAQRNSSSQYA